MDGWLRWQALIAGWLSGLLLVCCRECLSAPSHPHRRRGHFLVSKLAAVVQKTSRGGAYRHASPYLSFSRGCRGGRGLLAYRRGALPVCSLAVITNSFHLPRTRAIFEKVFSLPRHPSPPEGGGEEEEQQYKLTFVEVPDVGMDDQAAGREGLIP